MINDVIKSIQSNININIDIDENFKTLKITSSSNSKIKLVDRCISILTNNLINKRDTLIDFIIKINTNPIIYDFDNPNSFWSEYKSFMDNIDDDDFVVEYKLEITIKKTPKNNVLSIYSLDCFTKYLNTLKFSDIFKLLYKYKNISFEILDKSVSINSCTNSFYFYTCHKEQYTLINSENKLLDFHSENCNFLNRINFQFEPNDFKLNINYNNDLCKLFNKMYITFCLIYIFDVSEIKDNTLELLLYGKVMNKFTIDLKQVDFDNLNIYTDIFNWIYNSKNIVDKLLIARNVLLVNLIKESSIDIPSSILSTIKSNFKIYTTDNYEKYVNSKTSAIANLLDIQNKIFELSDKLSENFIKNITAVGSFIFTVIVLNQVGNGTFTDIFSKDVTLISIMLIILSFIFLNYTLNDIKTKKKNLKSLQNNINKIYKDILSKETLDEITEKNEYYSETITLLDIKIKSHTRKWILCIIIFWITTVILGWTHYLYVINYIINHIKNCFIK